MIIFILLLQFCLSLSFPYEMCQNGGEESNDPYNPCDCKNGFAGKYCEKISCVNGIYNPINNTCNCNRGWNSTSCDICMDSYYQNEDNSTYYICGKDEYCDKTIKTYKERNFNCWLTDEETVELIGQRITGKCVNDTTTPDDDNDLMCTIHSWTMLSTEAPNKQNEIFFCNLRKCYFEISKIGKVSYSCRNTTCSPAKDCPGDKCHKFLRTYLSKINGESYLQCSDIYMKNCFVRIEKFAKSVEFSCSTGECVSLNSTTPIRIRELNKTLITIIIVFIIVVFFLVLIVGNIILYWRQKKIGNYSFQLFKKFGNEIISSIKVDHLNYRIGKIKILDDVSFELSRGKIYACIGPIGSGKTNLFDIISGKIIKSGKIDLGTTKIEVITTVEDNENFLKSSNNKTINDKLKKIKIPDCLHLISYVTSLSDTLPEDQTVLQYLRLYTNLFYPSYFSNFYDSDDVDSDNLNLNISSDTGSDTGSDNQRNKKESKIKNFILKMISHLKYYYCCLFDKEIDVNEFKLEKKIIDLLNWFKLKDISNRLIKNLSTGQKKIVKIILEVLLDKPILILDEPTSNLDTGTIDLLLNLFVSERKKGKIILFSSHSLDDTLAKNRVDCIIALNDGKVIYNDSLDNISPTFASTVYENLICKNVNHLSALCLNLKSMNMPYYSKNNQIKENLNNNNDINDVNDNELQNVKIIESNKQDLINLIVKAEIPPNYHYTTLLKQCLLLLLTGFKTIIRNYYILPATLITSILISSLFGFYFFNSSYNFVGCQNRLSVIGLTCIYFALLSFTSLQPLIQEKPVYISEKMSNLYYTFSYYFSKTTIDLIYKILATFVFTIILYFTVGLKATFFSFLFFNIIIFMFNIINSNISFGICCVCENYSISVFCVVIYLLFGFLHNGIFLSKYNYNVISSRLKYFSPWYYVVNSLFTNELIGVKYYIDAPGIDPIKGKGEDILFLLGFDYDNFYYDILFLLCFVVGTYILAGFLHYFFVKPKN
jgi:ATP-binding cassette, subfamily G (WHITE), member 2